jgi:predicted ribosome quality control (RQC) complex YloA/Tae2 family protein
LNEKTINAIIAELSPELKGRLFGKIFQLAKFQFAIDFRLSDGKYLFIAFDAQNPRIYLIKRRLRDLEKQSKYIGNFAQLLRKRISGFTLENIEKIENERIIKFHLFGKNEIGVSEKYNLVGQFTGRSANLILLDEKSFVIDALKDLQIGTKYEVPKSLDSRLSTLDSTFEKGEFETLSEALDIYYQQFNEENLFQQKAKSLQQKLKSEITKREKLIKKLNQDLQNHGNAEDWKKLGDLLLANLANAVRIEDTVLVTDYFDDNLPTLEIEIDKNLSLTEASEKFFKRYTKARNANVEISKRLEKLQSEIEDFKRQEIELQEAINEKDLSAYFTETVTNKGNKVQKTDEISKYARRYNSSDNLEILVGRNSKHNDFLTFKIAKSFDLWLHAAEYAGSHVIIRNPNKLEIPTKTLIEAAELAAYFSQGKKQVKAAVHYTLRKFVHKPKGAVAGLVNLTSFKTILVEPNESLEKTK